MSYVALYRKFRPQTFAQVKGQDHVVRTLKNQIKNNRIGHAYLFTGTRGTGKTSVAKIMAKAVNCLHPVDGEPCNECENCREIDAGSFMDVVEMDAASNNGVADIRQLIEEVQFTPAKGKYKVFIIDEAHMITKSAFNAFLKTLEEPPAYAVFILATTEPHKLLQTILSRVQRYDFKRISADVIKENLRELTEKEGAHAEDKALEYIARLGDGSMRDAISLLDKCIAFSLGKELTYEVALGALGTVDTEIFSMIFRAVYEGDSVGALKYIDQAVGEGKDLSRFVADFCGYLRNLLLVGMDENTAKDILGISEENMSRLKEDARQAEPETVIRYIKILSELVNALRFSTLKQILTEIAFIKLSRPQMETDNEAVLDRIRQLEAGMSVLPQKIAELQRENASDAAQAETAGELPYDIPEGYYEEWEPLQDMDPGQGEKVPMGEPMSPGSDIVLNWDKISGGAKTHMMRNALSKAKPYEENGILTIYVNNQMAHKAVNDGIEEVKELIKTKIGRNMENIAVKEGTPPGSSKTVGPKSISDEEYMFQDIYFDNIETEEF